jgi:hypothetical protein
MISAVQYQNNTAAPSNYPQSNKPQDETSRLKQEFTSQFYESSGQLKA